MPNELLSSPLSEADPLSLQTVMDMDVLTLAKTPAARRLVIESMREQRGRWNVAQKKSKAKGVIPTGGLSLEDLGDIKL